MDTEITIGGFDLTHVVIFIIVVGVIIFIFYWLWAYPCDGGDPKDGVASPDDPRVSVPDARRGQRPTSLGEGRSLACCSRGDKPVDEVSVLYAMEIEPGTIVLQSPDGELFRVLQELDSVSRNGTSTTTTTTSSLPSFEYGRCVPVHYIPAYTCAHLQTQPTAPPDYAEVYGVQQGPRSSVDIPRSSGENSRSSGEGSRPSDNWRPLCIRSDW